MGFVGGARGRGAYIRGLVYLLMMVMMMMMMMMMMMTGAASGRGRRWPRHGGG